MDVDIAQLNSDNGHWVTFVGNSKDGRAWILGKKPGGDGDIVLPVTSESDRKAVIEFKEKAEQQGLTVSLL